MKSKITFRGPTAGQVGGSNNTDVGNSNLTEPVDHNLSELSERDPMIYAPPLTDFASSSLEGLDFVAEIKNRYHEDPFFRVIMEQPKEFRNFVVKDGYVYLNTHEKLYLCIPKILIKGRSAREIVISEAHSMLAHLGSARTAQYLRSQVWWKDLISDTKSFCETCMTCKRSKPSNQKPYGLLNPLNVPTQPWESIGVDFVGPLPESTNRDGKFDTITVVICLLTSMVHLIPSKSTYNAKQIAELMFEMVYKLHGLPKHIISDRDVLFTSIFWRHLHALIGTKLRMSSAYHPQSDGSTERANRTVTQMLRQCVGDKQTDWVSKLPAIEFAINSARSESTGYAPFFLNTGRMPRSMIWDSAAPSEYPSIRNFALQKKLALISAHDSILAARVKQSRDANRKRREEPFKCDDLVYISTKNIKFAKGLARKLIPKYIGPYRIIRDFGNHSFEIDLPAPLKQRGVHPTFHSSLLRIHHPNDDRLFPGRLESQLSVELDSEGEWAVDRIILHSGIGLDALFEVRWTAGDITWLPYEQVRHLEALNQYLLLLGVAHASQLSAGTGKPPLDDPQVSLFYTDFDFVKYHDFTDTFIILSPPSSTPPSSLNFQDHPQLLLSTMPDDMLPSLNHTNITHADESKYGFTDPASGHDDFIHITNAQIAEIIAFDALLRNLEPAARTHRLPNTPVMYDQFVRVFNLDPLNGSLGFVTWNGDAYDFAYNAAPTLCDFHIEKEQFQGANNTKSTYPLSNRSHLNSFGRIPKTISKDDGSGPYQHPYAPYPAPYEHHQYPYAQHPPYTVQQPAYHPQQAQYRPDFTFDSQLFGDLLMDAARTTLHHRASSRRQFEDRQAKRLNKGYNGVPTKEYARMTTGGRAPKPKGTAKAPSATNREETPTASGSRTNSEKSHGNKAAKRKSKDKAAEKEKSPEVQDDEEDDAEEDTQKKKKTTRGSRK